MTHPILSIWFHHPAEFYDSYQRLCVAFGSIFTILAVNAMFFGQGKQSVEQDLSIAIYAALITAPVGVCFPMLFTRAAATVAAQARGQMRGNQSRDCADLDSFFHTRTKRIQFEFQQSSFPGLKTM